MKMMMLRPNKYIKKILDGSKRFVDKGLTLEQIQWRGENKNDKVLGLMTTTGTFFKKPLQLILLQKSDGGYRLFTVRSKKDGIIPCFLFDIIGIEEFVKRYPIVPVYDAFGSDISEKIVEELEEIKDKPAIGFIEIRENADTMVFEIP